MLDERLGKREGGGTRPSSSKRPCFILSGEPVETGAFREEVDCKLLSLQAGDGSECFSYWDWLSLWIGDGERSWRAPKTSPRCWTGSICRPRRISGNDPGKAGTSTSGVGGIWLMRGCIDLGRSSFVNASSISVLKPKPEEGSGDSGSDTDSADIERKYSDRPWTIKGDSTVRGGNLLILFPSLLLSCSCLASRRL